MTGAAFPGGTRRRPPLSGAVIVLLLAFGCGSESASRPNVLLVMLDSPVLSEQLHELGYLGEEDST
jgi:hypothetical protein